MLPCGKETFLSYPKSTSGAFRRVYICDDYPSQVPFVSPQIQKHYTKNKRNQEKKLVMSIKKVEEEKIKMV